MERETLVEVVVSVASVVVFILAIAAVGVSYAGGGLGGDGGLVLIGLIVAFIVGMTGVGYWLSAREN